MGALVLFTLLSVCPHPTVLVAPGKLAPGDLAAHYIPKHGYTIVRHPLGYVAVGSDSTVTWLACKEDRP
jgi:hypothetical protein